MKKSISIFIKIIAIILTIFVLSLIAAVHYINSDHAKAILAELLNNSISGKIIIKDYKLKLINGSIEINGIEITDKNAKQLISFDRINIKLAIGFSLLRGEIKIKTFYIEHPVILLEEDQAGKLTLFDIFIPNKTNAANIENLSNENKNSRPLNLVVKKFLVKDAVVKYIKPNNQVMLDASNINILSNADFTLEKGKLDFKIGKGSLVVNDLTKLDFDMQLSANLLNKLVSFEYFALNIADTKIRAIGEYRTVSQTIKASFGVDVQSSESIFSLLGIANTRGKISLQGSIEGAVSHPTIDFKVLGDYLSFENCILGTLDIKGTLKENGVLEISDLNLKNKNSVVTGKGYITLFEDNFITNTQLPFEMSFSMFDIETKNFFQYDISTGKIDGKLEVQGNINQIKSRLELRGQQIAVDMIKIGDIDALVRFDEGKFSVERLIVQNGKSRLSITGDMTLFKNPGFTLLLDPLLQFNLDGNDLDPNDLGLQHLGLNINGVFSVSAKVGGSINKPFGNALLEASGVNIEGIKIERIRTDLKFDKEKLGFEPIKLTFFDKETINASGWISQDRLFQLKVFSDKIRMSHIAEQLKDQAILDGSIELNLSGQGDLTNPQLQGNITITKVRVNNSPLYDINAKISLKDYIVKVQAEPDFKLNAEYNILTEDFTSNINFDYKSLDSYFRIAGKDNFQGKLKGSVVVQGNVKRLEKVSGKAKIAVLETEMDKRFSLVANDMDIELKDQQLKIKPFQITLPNRTQLEGYGNISFKGPTDFQINGKIPMSFLSIWYDDIPDIQGSIGLRLYVKGNMTNPEIDADITLENIGFQIPELVQQVHDVNGHIEINPKRITIDKISGRLDKGQFSLQGKIDIKDGFVPGNILLSFDANAFPINVPEMFDSLYNINLQLQKTEEKTLISGDILILEATYFQNIDLGLMRLVSKKNKLPSPKIDLNDYFLKNTSFNVSIRHRNSIVVDNNLAFLVLLPDLNITGTPSKPIVSGRAIIESGNITFQRKTFVVNKGVIDFVNPYKLEPIIDIESQVTVRDWNITLKIYGTPNKPAFQLSSNPSEEHADILSLLVIGKTTRELMAKEGGVSQSTSQMLAEAIASTFGDDIKKTTGLDIFQVETSNGKTKNSKDSKDNKDNKAESIKVTLGKELSKRMTVIYSVETKNNETVQCATTEYKLLENILMKGFQDTEGIFGGEVQFRLEFR